MFKSLKKIQDANEDLASEANNLKQAKLHEIVADNYVNIKLYEKAIDHYLMVLESVHHLNNKAKANIYSSIAATYVEMKEYDKGLYYYQRELEAVDGDYEQMSRTHRNIADIEEKKG